MSLLPKIYRTTSFHRRHLTRYLKKNENENYRVIDKKELKNQITWHFSAVIQVTGSLLERRCTALPRIFPAAERPLCTCRCFSNLTITKCRLKGVKTQFYSLIYDCLQQFHPCSVRCPMFNKQLNQCTKGKIRKSKEDASAKILKMLLLLAKEC